ncbi:MAG: amidohydrolase family protein [Acidobacteriota bacterium]|jgi:Tol biopolymer transport system component/imidazolonepropionase-like amidohydrolase
MRKLVLTALAAMLMVAPLAAQEEGGSSGRPDGLSLEPDRTVAFTTTEGTYMNLDVSPDGTTIAFDLLGDIYTVPVTGGQATRITSGMGYDSQPAYSPDGARIAYMSDNSGSDNIWVVDAAGGEPHQVTRERNDVVALPEWDPDGEYILTRKAGRLWLYHVDGGSGTALGAEEDTGGVFGHVFSPDGRYVYFSDRAGGGGGGLSFTNWQVRRLDRVTGDVASITAHPNGAFRPVISPDGNWLVYGARLDAQTGLRIRDLRSDREEWLVYPIDRDNAERPGNLDLMPGYDFTPDGEAIIIATGGTFHRIDIATKSDTSLAFSADIELDLGPFVYFEQRITEEPVTVRNLRYVNRGPDGARVVFSALSQIWAMEPPDGEPFPLVRQDFGQFQPVLSPDGSALVYVSWDDTEGGHLWRLPLEGSEAGTPQRLTEYPGYYLHPTWSPDGTKVAFMKEDAAAFRNIWSRNTGMIVWMDAGGGPLNIVGSAPSDNILTFSPDGTRISYVADVSAGRQAESEYVSVRLDGTDRRTVANIRAETYEVAPSPDGRWIAFSVREDIFVAALPLTAEPPTIGERSGPGPVKRITREGGIDLHWEDGSETLAWTFADTFYRINVNEAMAPEADEGEDADEPAGAAATRAPAAAQGEQAETEAEERPGVRPDALKITMSQPRDVPRGTVALVGADVIAMTAPAGASADEAILRDATVIVGDNRIMQVGPSDEVDIPNGADVIDVSGKFIMPGMVDLHAHLRPPREVFVETSWSYLANLAYGVTTTRDVSTSNDSFAYGELVETGRAVGPRIFSTGRAMTTGNARIESYEDALSMVRHYKRLGTGVIKQYMQPHRRQRQWVIEAAREEGMNVTNEGGGDLRLDLTMVLDGYTGFEHSLPVADIYDDVVQLIARSHTWYTPTLVVSYGGPTAEWYFYQTTDVHGNEKLARFTPHDDLDRRTRRGQMNALDEYHFIAVAEGTAAVYQAGGHVGLGAHGEQQGICAHWELWAQQMGGVSNYDALRIATVMGADGLGMLQDLGTIEAGKLADLIVLDANPLEDIRNSNTISMVMKNGDLFDGGTLQMLWPETRPAPETGFQREDPVGLGGEGRR